MAERQVYRTVLGSKLHRVHVTEADVDYEGSIGIDKALLDRANICIGEQVHVWNCTNGNRLVTYAIEEESGSGSIKPNGAAAHLCDPGDILIIATFVSVAEDDALTYEPRIVHVDERTNRLKVPEKS